MAQIEIKDLESQKRQLKASFDMWEKTIKESIAFMKKAKAEDKKTAKYTEAQIKEKVELLKNGEQDVIDKWLFLGGTMEELKGEGKSSKPVVKKKKQENKTVFEQIEDIETKDTSKEPKKKYTEDDMVNPIGIIETDKLASSFIPNEDEANPLASYDIIPLPSKGECYPNKQGKIAVSYLTAIDENIIVSPNLYRDNMVLDIILNKKIRSQDISPDDLLDGDRDAIILFLRTSAYGNMYSVNVTDPDSGQKFETKIDLSKIKFKDFTLVGDENGYFDYELPILKDKIKFKFLSHKDYVRLAMLDEVEVDGLRKKEIERYNEKLNFYVNEDKKLTTNEKENINKAISTLKDWADRTNADETKFSHRISNELEMQIVSVNGNTDRKFIHEYVAKMPIKDSTDIRRYIARNTPGVDYNFTIEKPESLGGGSMSVFLQFDQFIFLVDTE